MELSPSLAVVNGRQGNPFRRWRTVFVIRFDPKAGPRKADSSFLKKPFLGNTIANRPSAKKFKYPAAEGLAKINGHTRFL